MAAINYISDVAFIIFMEFKKYTVIFHSGNPGNLYNLGNSSLKAGRDNCIDINTGKFVGRGNSLEETITQTNLEAVKEIVRQIRLRDLGGIIVIDFIDMDERKNRKRVMEALSEEIAKDKSPSKILEFNEFGLVAITRKRVKQSLERTLCQPCPYCTGSGMVKSIATTCYSIYHEIEKMRNYLDERSDLMIRTHPDVARALRESESIVIKEIRSALGKDVMIKADPSLHIEHFNIVT